MAKRARAADPRHLAVVAEEQALLERVRCALRRAAKRASRGRAGGGGEFESLREELFEAREDDVGLLLALMHQQAARDGTAFVGALPDVAAPYFAHLRLRTGGRRRDVLLGPRPLPGLGESVAIVDWRRAPIAEVFFTCRSGDDYELDTKGCSLSGVVEARRLLTFREGELASVSIEGGTLRRTVKGWRFEPSAISAPLTGAPDAPLAAQLVAAAGSDTPLQLMPPLLDSHQRALLDHDPLQPLLVLGSAGCGKTTVALQRAKRLCTDSAKEFPPWRTLVVVPERGLRRLSERLLAELELPEVKVRTFDEWVAEQARKLFPWLPTRRAPDTPLAVSALKRHPALLTAMDRLVDEWGAQLASHLDRRLRTEDAIQRAMAERREPVLAVRLRKVEAQIVRSTKKRQRPGVQQAFREISPRLLDIRDDFVRLVGDRALLELAMRRSGGTLAEHHVAATIAHTSRQLDEPARVRYAHIEPERLKTVDGKDIDEGTPDELAGTLDAEDFAIVLELLFRKTGRTTTPSRKLRRAAHLVVDEAQELAPIELRALARAVRGQGAAVTVAGDAAQQVDAASGFSSWDATLRELGVIGAASSCLQTTYRCPRPVAELAHRLLGPLAPPAMPNAPRSGPPVSRTIVPGEGHAAVVIAEALADLGVAQPRASIAVIARHAPSARALHQVLARGLDVRLVLDGSFAFGPGIEVTEVAQVKGLEFDYVIVPDATVRAYPDRPEARRSLHVAVTRAAHQVWLVCPGTPSPLLPEPR